MTSLISLLSVLPLVAQPILADAECMSYSVETITDCGPAPTNAPPTSTPGPGGVITITMPACPHCTCECSHVKTYTTIYEAFCPTGVATVTYTVEEVYHGMSTAPGFPTPTDLPHGFTTTVATCNSCGSAPITRTLTYPVGGQPSVPTSGPGQPGTSGSPGNSGGSGQSGQPGTSGTPGEGGPVGAAGALKLNSMAGNLLAIIAAAVAL